MSTIGNHLKITLFGESHQDVIGCTISNIAPGIKLDIAFIQSVMDLRRAKGALVTQRQESDQIKIVSGYFNGYTTGTPLTILIENTKQRSSDYSKVYRPAHADYTGEMKYLGYQDYRGGGHFSGRITAPLVAAGAICLSILKSKNIEIASHILNLYQIEDQAFNAESFDVDSKKCFEPFAVINDEVKVLMKEKIEEIKNEKDSIGGVIETMVCGLDAGIGEPFFHSLESEIARMLFSIGGVKGVEFGLGFDYKNHKGSEVNDALYFKDSKVYTKTNFNGGINGGISNGMPIVIKTAIKPTPSIYKAQDTIDMENKSNTTLEIVGRHDPAIIVRANVVITCCTAIALVDSHMARFGYMWMK